MGQPAETSRVAVYARISRDDNKENFESIENQRDMLLAYTEANKLGKVAAVYMDDNVSGSAVQRPGLDRMKEDILKGMIDVVLVKDLSRLGRNNAATLQLIDFFEEHGVRVVTADGRFDSLVDSDMVGIETWVNERYVRDISRKIRAALRFKIQKGEYLGKAPFGYRKSGTEKNRLVADESEAHIVMLIYRLYLSGMGYTAISKYLEEKGYASPQNRGWNRITVRRILSSRVYIGDTVQGVSEKVSFKSKKTRRLPESSWVITEGTHEALVPREIFDKVQAMRMSRTGGRKVQGRMRHVLSGIIYCGGCGSAMYARRRSGGIAYVCGNYCRNGKKACTSHFVYEREIVGHICSELMSLFRLEDEIAKLKETFGDYKTDEQGRAWNDMNVRMENLLRRQELLYRDRLEGRISGQLFDRMNRQLEKHISALEDEMEKLRLEQTRSSDFSILVKSITDRLEKGELTNEMVSAAVSSIVVHDETVTIDLKYKMA
ncbi:MAG TPA: recombinase family protein [Clostridiales bacterium]|nr:recombinase family protein [Clostridiales bacterium]HOL91323.1 recombinase family protein [Clostridiales bacterium]HPP34993.1 recombinase family protein [Clostridiales bacterium]